MTGVPVLPELPPISSLLATHGLADADEQPFEHNGFSGAILTRLGRNDGAPFVVKRMSMANDWIMRATEDHACREAMLAASAIDLGTDVRSPAIGAARDGDVYALLMHDISAHLLPPGMIDEARCSSIIAGMARLHSSAVPADALPYCDASKRLTLLTRDTARIAQAYGAPVARDLVEGWTLFDTHASPRAVEIITALSHDPGPLLRALQRLPPAFLHGDMKLDNIGLDSEGRLWLIDWSMTLVAPVAIELGWFMAINSRRLPVSLDDVMDQYAAAAAVSDEHRARHDGLSVLCGLLLRGWRKALDAEDAQPEELHWWCERAEAAAPFLS